MPLLVVVVPALPKDAAVELHVTAIQDDPTKRTSCHMTTKVSCGSIESYAVSASAGQSASLSLSLAVPSENVEVTDENSVTEEVCMAFKKAIKEMDAELVPQCARAFYKCSHSLAQQIVKGMYHHPQGLK